MTEKEELLEELYKKSMERYDRELSEEYRIMHVGDRILRTEEIRYMLHYALQNANDHIFISCPWLFYDADTENTFLRMTTKGLDRNTLESKEFDLTLLDKYKISKDCVSVEDELKALAKRKVDIVIQYGYSDEDNKKSDNAIEELRKKKFHLNVGAGGIIIKKMPYNHQKILIMDYSLLIVGSYNFLSFPGAIDDVGYRKERAYMTDDDRTIQRAWDAVL